ncbi:MAG TPA: amino acid permease, partial [Thermoguttaceae bacterium]|nr:amino acid permease [Thermoguttaceae bacterium]
PRTGTPVRAVLVQGAIATILVIGLGSFIDALLFTAAAVYSFYLATSVAVIVLRFREPDVERPYRVTGYPFTTLIFCAVCVLLIYSSVTYAAGVYSEDAKKWSIAMVALGLLVAGLPLYWLTTPRAANAGPAENE